MYRNITILTSVFILCLHFTAKSQLQTTVNSNANQLAQQLAGQGVQITNATLSAPTGFAGEFNSQNANVGINKGVLLATGDIANAEGPNNSGSITTAGGGAGDVDLDILANQTTYDAAVLEFDIFTVSDTLLFRYVFGSDEYLEYVGSINDVFGFFISGPGITGPFSNNSMNIATIPGTSTPVAINTINNVSNSQYYINNGDGFTSPYNNNNTYIQYDGKTVVLTAKVPVKACETYHLKLAIADASDQILDSGVFLEAGSISSTGVKLEATTSVGQGFPYAIEGCNYGIFEFTRSDVDTMDYVIHFNIGGTANNGADYPFTPDSVIIPANDTTVQVIISPTPDGITEGLETVIFYLVDPCSGTEIFDSAVLYLNDYIVPFGANDTVLCKGDSVQYDISGAVKYTWTPSTGVSNDTIPNPVIIPQGTTEYVLKMEVASCVEYDTITVAISPPVNADAGPDTTVCEDGSVQLQGSGNGTFYWAPNTTLDDGSSKTPVATPFGDIHYTLLIIDSAGCKDADTVFVEMVPNPTIEAFNDTTICQGNPANLHAEGAATYLWAPTASLDDAGIQSPTAIPIQTTDYTVIGYDQNKCSDTAYLKVKVRPAPQVDAGPAKEINIGESVALDGSTNGVSFTWSPNTDINDVNTLNPNVSPQETLIYTLEAAGDNGCTASDTVRVTVILQGEVFVPNAFTPNGDGSNDYFSVIVQGVVDVQVFKVYNRWGEVVFEGGNDDVDLTGSGSAGWDGTFKGEPQPAGVYTFVFIGKDPQDKEIQKTGHITLIR